MRSCRRHIQKSRQSNTGFDERREDIHPRLDLFVVEVGDLVGTAQSALEDARASRTGSTLLLEIRSVRRAQCLGTRTRMPIHAANERVFQEDREATLTRCVYLRDGRHDAPLRVTGVGSLRSGVIAILAVASVSPVGFSPASQTEPLPSREVPNRTAHHHQLNEGEAFLIVPTTTSKSLESLHLACSFRYAGRCIRPRDSALCVSSALETPVLNAKSGLRIGARGQLGRAHTDGGSAAYLMSLMMLNIGKYSEMIMPPTHTPITTINKGSMSDVSASTVASTSWS